MEFKDIPIEYQFEYERKCELCLKPVKIYTQKEDEPQYHTSVFTQCACGNYMEFELPVY